MKCEPARRAGFVFFGISLRAQLRPDRIRIDPELLVGEPLPRELHQIGHLGDLGYPRRVE